MNAVRDRSTEELARAQGKYLSGVMWHAGTFVIINVFFWTLDLLIGQDGVQWAHWITLFWGIALTFHLLAYAVAGRNLEERATERFIRQH